MEKQDTELAVEGVHALAANIMVERGLIDTLEDYTNKYKWMIDEVLNGSRQREAEHRHFMKGAWEAIDQVREALNGRR